MRKLDILRSKDQNTRKWDPRRDRHSVRTSLDPVQSGKNHGCCAPMRWVLKPTTTHQTGEKGFHKTFVVDIIPDTLSTAQMFSYMFALRAKPKAKDREKTPLFSLDGVTEVTLDQAKRKLVEKFM